MKTSVSFHSGTGLRPLFAAKPGALCWALSLPSGPVNETGGSSPQSGSFPGFPKPSAGYGVSVEEHDNELRTYLDDHYAETRAAVELARQARDDSADPERRVTWQNIVEESETDHEILGKMLESLGFGRDRVGLFVAWAGKKSARLKPNGRLGGPSALGQLFEIEMMFLSVTRKLFLWMNLAAADYPKLRKFDLDELIARAESQRDRLDDHRIMLGAEVFGPSGTVI
jgi:hypothetical protein